jgi:hypothetical protein
MAPRPDTRDELRRALALNALGRPVNVLVPVVVAVIGGVLGAAWLAAVAVVCWLALALITFLDEDEARRVGRLRRASRAGGADEPPRVAAGALAPALAARLEAAEDAQERIREAADGAELPLDDLTGEVDALVGAMAAHAERAQRIEAFLAERPPGGLERRIATERSPAVVAALEAQLQALARLRRRHDDLLAEMDHVVASLDTIYAEVLAADGLGDAVRRRAVASRVAELRTDVQLVSEGLDEAFDETRAAG